MNELFVAPNRNTEQGVGMEVPDITGTPVRATHYIVERCGQRSDHLATPEEIANFLNACSFAQGSPAWQAALGGEPFTVDGGALRLIAVARSAASRVPPAWIVHAYPLHQIRIELQGTRHSSRQHIIAQLEAVLARLRAGEEGGVEDDDDFGYRFTVTTTASASVLGD